MPIPDFFCMFFPPGHVWWSQVQGLKTDPVDPKLFQLLVFDHFFHPCLFNLVFWQGMPRAWRGWLLGLAELCIFFFEWIDLIQFESQFSTFSGVGRTESEMSLKEIVGTWRCTSQWVGCLIDLFSWSQPKWVPASATRHEGWAVRLLKHISCWNLPKLASGMRCHLACRKLSERHPTIANFWTNVFNSKHWMTETNVHFIHGAHKR